MENIKAAARLPVRSGSAFIALWPHPLEIRRKAKRKFRRMQAVEFKQRNRARTRRSNIRGSIRGEHDLANGERRMRVSDDSAVGPNLNLRRLSVHIDGNAIAFN